MAVRSMAGGQPLDMQREARWPGQTNPAIEVEWKPWQDDSDVSDTEGMLGPTSSSLISQAKKLILLPCEDNPIDSH